MANEKRVVFKSAWLPSALIAPQVVVITVFFFWPAAQALMQIGATKRRLRHLAWNWSGSTTSATCGTTPSYLASFTHHRGVLGVWWPCWA